MPITNVNVSMGIYFCLNINIKANLPSSAKRRPTEGSLIPKTGKKRQNKSIIQHQVKLSLAKMKGNVISSQNKCDETY